MPYAYLTGRIESDDQLVQALLRTYESDPQPQQAARFATGRGQVERQHSPAILTLLVF